LGWDAQVLDSGLESANVPYSYGFSIILLTILVKILTFPLSKQQVESTMAMQVGGPRRARLNSPCTLSGLALFSPIPRAEGGSLLCCD
jgi:hypothetical protein